MKKLAILLLLGIPLAAYPVETAAWIGCGDDKGDEPAVYRFRCTFTAQREITERVYVSGDERYVLYLDGKEIARGPDRGYPTRWYYRECELPINAGSHQLDAVVWRFGDFAPLSQLSWRGGTFWLKATGDMDEQLTTGRGNWMSGRIYGFEFGNDCDRGNTYGVGWPLIQSGCSILDKEPEVFQPVVVVRANGFANDCGVRPVGWQMIRSPLPEQLQKRSGEVIERMPLMIAGDSQKEFLVDLGEYHCAYPDLHVSGGKGSQIRWGWMERLENDCFTDTFISDGRENAHFTTPWWRSGRWCKITIKTAKSPIKLISAAIVDTGYPMECSGRFDCDDPSIRPIQEICLRSLKMCSHEISYDCPFYEQQMYPGDARIQFLTWAAVSSDSRLILNNLDLFDHDRRPSGWIPMNTPTRGAQDSGTYSMCYPIMLADALRWRDCKEWLRGKIAGARQTMSALGMCELPDGALGRLPGWCFADWNPAWEHGCAPCGTDGASAFNSLYYLLALRAMIEVETALGEDVFAKAWNARAERVAGACRSRFWDKDRGLMADSESRDSFSEHVQCLALLSGAVAKSDERFIAKGLEENRELTRTSVYFSAYLFETYFKIGRGDLFLKKLDLWRDYVKQGFSTTPEHPGNPRSVCHAWGAHPLYFMSSGLAGIRPSAPFFKRMEVSPCPGTLKDIKACVPSPSGLIELELHFRGGKVFGWIVTPVPGEFVWNGKRKNLVLGKNLIGDQKN